MMWVWIYQGCYPGCSFLILKLGSFLLSSLKSTGCTLLMCFIILPLSPLLTSQNEHLYGLSQKCVVETCRRSDGLELNTWRHISHTCCCLPAEGVGGAEDSIMRDGRCEHALNLNTNIWADFLEQLNLLQAISKLAHKVLCNIYKDCLIKWNFSGFSRQICRGLSSCESPCGQFCWIAFRTHRSHRVGV